MLTNPDNQAAFEELIVALDSLDGKSEIRSFLTDLLTPAECDSISGRFRVVRLLEAGRSYRQIAAATGVSTATITRVARFLSTGAGGYRLVLNRMKQKAPDTILPPCEASPSPSGEHQGF